MSATAATLDAPGTPARLMRNLQRVAALLAVASVGLAGVVVAYGVYGSVAFLTPNLVTGGFLGIIVIFPAMGALIIQRRPATRVAWLMVLLGISMGVGLAMYAYGLNGLPPSEPQPFAMAAMLGSQMFFIPALGTATTLILLLFPDDRFLSVRWRLVAWLAAISAAVYVLTGLVQPGLVDAEYLPGIWNPLGVPSDLGPAVRLLNNAANLSELLALLLASISLIVRYRRADRIVAAQIRWLAAVAVLLVLVFSLSLIPADEAIGDLVFGLALCLLASVPIAIGIAITRYRLYEIDRLINRALVYGSLTAILAGVFTAGVGLAQRMFVAVTHETSDAAVVGATLVVATLYAPLRKRLEAIVDRRFKFEDARFGGYRDELTRYLALTEPGRAWPRLTSESVRELDAVGAAVVDGSGTVLARAGLWPVEAVVRLPLDLPSGPIATLLLGPRRDGRPHDDRSVAMLADVARLAAQAIEHQPRMDRPQPHRR